MPPLASPPPVRLRTEAPSNSRRTYPFVSVSTHLVHSTHVPVPTPPCPQFVQPPRPYVPVPNMILIWRYPYCSVAPAIEDLPLQGRRASLAHRLHFLHYSRWSASTLAKNQRRSTRRPSPTAQATGRSSTVQASASPTIGSSAHVGPPTGVGACTKATLLAKSAPPT